MHWSLYLQDCTVSQDSGSRGGGRVECDTLASVTRPRWGGGGGGGAGHGRRPPSPGRRTTTRPWWERLLLSVNIWWELRLLAADFQTCRVDRQFVTISGGGSPSAETGGGVSHPWSGDPLCRPQGFVQWG